MVINQETVREHEAQVRRENTKYDNLPFRASCKCGAAKNFATFDEYRRVAEQHLERFGCLMVLEG